MRILPMWHGYHLTVDREGRIADCPYRGRPRRDRGPHAAHDCGQCRFAGWPASQYAAHEKFVRRFREVLEIVSRRRWRIYRLVPEIFQGFSGFVVLDDAGNPRLAELVGEMKMPPLAVMLPLPNRYVVREEMLN